MTTTLNIPGTILYARIWQSRAQPLRACFGYSRGVVSERVAGFLEGGALVVSVPHVRSALSSMSLTMLMVICGTALSVVCTQDAHAAKLVPSHGLGK